MGITGANPIVISSGTTCSTDSDPIFKGKAHVDRVIWLQPDLGISSVIITERISGGAEILRMKSEVSGETQTVDFHGKPWNRPFVHVVPSGTLYVYLR